MEPRNKYIKSGRMMFPVNKICALQVCELSGVWTTLVVPCNKLSDTQTRVAQSS